MVLLKDYELSENRLNQAETHFSALIVGTSALIGAAITFLAGNSTDKLTEPVAWLAPLAFILAYALILHEIYFRVTSYYDCRILSKLINNELKINGPVPRASPQTLLFRFKRLSPHDFYSFSKRAYLPFSVLYLILILSNIILFACITYQSYAFLIKQTQGQASIWLFSLLYLPTFLAEILSLFAVIFGLPIKYRKIYINTKHLDDPEEGVLAAGLLSHVQAWVDTLKDDTEREVAQVAVNGLAVELAKGAKADRQALKNSLDNIRTLKEDVTARQMTQIAVDGLAAELDKWDKAGKKWLSRWRLWDRASTARLRKRLENIRNLNPKMFEVVVMTITNLDAGFAPVAREVAKEVWKQIKRTQVLPPLE